MAVFFTLLYALILAVGTGLFVYLALGGDGLSLPQFGTPAQYLMVAFIAFVNAALCAAALFVKE
jgi:hypothetical protein